MAITPFNQLELQILNIANTHGSISIEAWLKFDNPSTGDSRLVDSKNRAEMHAATRLRSHGLLETIRFQTWKKRHKRGFTMFKLQAFKPTPAGLDLLERQAA